MTDVTGDDESAAPQTLSISFLDYTDLQTRLVLMPRDEEEGIGAVVSAYYPVESEDDTTDVVGYVLLQINCDEKKCPAPFSRNVQQNPLFNLDFATILSTIRNQEAPIVLTFSSPLNDNVKAVRDDANVNSLPNPVKNEESEKLSAASYSAAFEEEKKSEELECRNVETNAVGTEAHGSNGDIVMKNPPSTDHALPGTTATTTSLFTSKNLSSWKSRMSAVAATSAAAFARAASEAKVTGAMVAAAVVPEFPTVPPATPAPTVEEPSSSSAVTATAIKDDDDDDDDDDEKNQSISGKQIPNLNLYVQSEAGTFVPVPEVRKADADDSLVAPVVSTSSRSSSPILTNSSYLTVRASVQHPAPNDCHYQWYRSFSATKWEPLPGANTPSFQPSATEIGYRLRCIISQESPKESSSDVNDENCIICETEDIVTASLPILNGSRQALARGAQFGGLLGQGKAGGRTFRVKIVISSIGNDRHRRRTAAAVTIYQVSGSTSEAFHSEDEPLLCHSAVVTDYGQTKNLALIFQSHALPPSASMVAALCSAEYEGDLNDSSSNHKLYFHLQAPNRLARESMLLAIGVANFKGKPVQLNASSILFHHHELASVESDDGSSWSGDGSDLLQCSSSHSSETPDQCHSPIGFSPEMTTPPASHRSASVGAVERHSLDGNLKEELESLRTKLARKDKVISELQRQLAQSDKAIQQTEAQLQSLESVSQKHQDEANTLRSNLATADQKFDALKLDFHNLKTEQDSRYGALECDLQLHKDRISKLEKENRALQNDKDVLKAAVETREFKLSKMLELQASLDDARAQLSQQSNFHLKMDEVNRRYAEARIEIEQMQASKSKHDEELRKSQERIVALEQSLEAESAKTLSHQSKLEMEQMTIQKLKAERNSYKQKGDSLAKEMSRLCRDGRTVREIEKILADDATRQEEVVVLREQKRKALEQVEHFRTAYEQSLCAQRLAGLDHDAGKLLERNAELERLLSELTEYLHAKEMQLDTMKQVNDALQSEIRDLAKAHMSKNDI